MIWQISLLILLIFIFFPLLGQSLYKLKNSTLFTIYLIFSIGFSIIIYLLASHTSWNDISNMWESYFSNLFRLKLTYVFSLSIFIIAGIGFIGGILEFVGEQTETANAYKKYDKFSPIKLYFYFQLYGYIFVFAIFAFSQFLTSLLFWEFSDENIRFLFDILLYHNAIIASVGIILYSMKVFRYGFLSIEFYRSEFHPSVVNAGPKIKMFRQFMAFILCPIGLYITVLMLLLIKDTPDRDANLIIGKTFFFLATIIHSILFYLLKDKFIDQLKPIRDQYELKVGSGPTSESEKEKSLKESDKELRFTD